MSRINISELQPLTLKSELKILDNCESDVVVGGRTRGIRNSFNNQSNTAYIFQVSNLINIQLSFGGGGNYSVNNITNNAGVNQANIIN